MAVGLKSQSGQMLVEIVFSVSIVATILTGLVVAVVYSQKATRSAHERAEAIHIAQEKIESLRGEKKANEDYFWDNVTSYSGTESNVRNHYERETVINLVETVAPHRRIKVTVTVSWQDGSSERSVDLTSYIAEY